MKEGWVYKALGEISTQITDGSHNPPKGVDYSEYPMLSSKNVFFDRYDYEAPRFLTKEEFDEENRRTNIEDGDVLLTIVGTVGRACCVFKPFVPFTLQRSVAVLKPQKDKILSRFLMYSLHSLSDLFDKEAKGVAQKGIYLKQLSKLSIPIPPLAEQEHIVSELDLLTSLIEKQRAELKELDTLAQSIFYDMFGDPIDNPKGWEVKKLGEVCACKSKIERANKFFEKGNYIEYIDISSIDNVRRVISSTTTYMFSAAPSRAQQRVKYGDILISLVRPNLQNIAIVLYNDNNLVASSGFCVLRVNSQVIKEYLFYLVQNHHFTDYLIQRVSGANYPAVREEDVKGYAIPLPPLSLQQSFAEKIEAIEAQKARISKSIEDTQRLFDYTMDKYFG